MFGNRANSGHKRELVVLIKPSIIRTAEDWEQHNRAATAALDDIETQTRRVITVTGSGSGASPPPASKVPP